MNKRFLAFLAFGLGFVFWVRHAISKIPSGRQANIEAIESPEATKYYLRLSGLPHFRLIYREVAARATKWMPGGKALDIGCGPGRLALQLAERTRYLKVIGIDLSQEMVNLAAATAEQAGLSDRVSFSLGSSENIPFPDASFDLVVSTLSLHHWTNPIAALNEIARVVKPGGRYMVFDLRRDVPPSFWALIYTVWRFFFPPSFRRAREPIGSIESAYTPQEASELAEQSNLKDWRITTGPIWLAIEANIP